MTKTYVKECIYCNKKIRMSDRQAGRWLPFNGDGSVHDCRDQNTGDNRNQEQKQVTLQAVQEKLQEIGIIINVERLMKQ